MNQLEEGIVIETNGNLAKVQASRHGDCKNCGACPGDQAMVVEVINDIGARKGQFVAFEVKEENLLKSSLVLFVLPLAAAAAGAALGNLLSAGLGLSGSIPAIIGVLLLFGLSLVYVRHYDRKANAKKDYPVIKKIII